ncbi:hypothetical protein GIB67_034716 [Kingdonia uniflora]|uniref:aminodeoxychorismate synthase n=1 Tax=Kingdonia uniflora TaxID=39325 RepID=A0A7J7ML61_9MAGN|nr:hypothetical protein GIB67_034716 [Kingdonia uniflora]
MNFSLISLSSETSCPRSKSLRYKSDKSLVFRPFIKLGCFNKDDHLLMLNRDARKAGVYQSLMPGHVKESYVGKNYSEDDTSSRCKFVRTLLIDNYDSYTYNIYQELSVINGVPPVVVHNDEWTWEYIRYCLYEEKAFDNIVISPGPGSPTSPVDIGICSRILLECKDIPILGVCLGHQAAYPCDSSILQALGYVHGAQIVRAPEPVHGRLSEIEHTGCNLFHDIPSGRNSGFKVVRYHSLVIDPDSLPRELIPIAWSYSSETLPFLDNQRSDVINDDLADPAVPRLILNNNFAANLKNRNFRSSKSSEEEERGKVIMGIMHTTRPHYGVQFHPESVATCHGKKIFENFRKMTVDYLLKANRIHERQVHNSGKLHLYLENISSSLFISDSYANENVDARFLKLKWKKFENLANQVGGAKDIFCELFGKQNAKNTFWLDSSSVEQRRARFSFMGGKGGSLWKQVMFKLSDRRNIISKSGGYLTIKDAEGSSQSTFLENGFLDFLNKELRSFRYEKEDYEGLPFDFCGGYVGFLGYDLKVECGVASNHHKSRTPDACFFFADNLLVIDHQNDDVYLLSIHDIPNPESSTTMSWLNITEQKLLDLKISSSKKLKKQTSRSVSQATFSNEAGFRSKKSRDEYMNDVEKCLQFINDGESYELCLTTQMQKRVANIDSLGIYINLRERNPAPYAAWLNFSDENLSICCSSPERFLQLDRNGILEAKPIKGTVGRGSTPEEDNQLKLQLQNSEKDQAENLMIVDLLRNDLGRVCEPGSVHVPRLMELESYATVHTLVSTIRGKKHVNLSPVDCIKAAFPGGSMTGAPKLRSVEILDSLESCSRGVYSGSIGFFSYNQTFDLNIVIRTVVIHEGEASIGAGGAIVALSNPEDEYNEMVLKTRAPMMTVMEYQSESD